MIVEIYIPDELTSSVSELLATDNIKSGIQDLIVTKASNLKDQKERILKSQEDIPAHLKEEAIRSQRIANARISKGK